RTSARTSHAARRPPGGRPPPPGCPAGAGAGSPPRRAVLRRPPDRRDQPGLANVDAAPPVPVQRLVGSLFPASLPSASLPLLACEVVPPGEPGASGRI